MPSPASSPDSAAATAPAVLRHRGAAAYIGVSESQLFEMIRRGEVRSITIGRLRRYPISLLDEFIAERIAADRATAS